MIERIANAFALSGLQDFIREVVWPAFAVGIFLLGTGSLMIVLWG